MRSACSARVIKFKRETLDVKGIALSSLKRETRSSDNQHLQQMYSRNCHANPLNLKV